MPARYISEMPRLLFNLICVGLFIAVMGGISYALKVLPLEFEGGIATGMFLTLSLLYACHKLGVRIF